MIRLYPQASSQRSQQHHLRAFSIAEVLIAIVIIAILTIGSISVFSAQLAKARDTERKNDITRMAGYLDEIVGRFGTPPGHDDISKKLGKVDGTNCKDGTKLAECFASLQMTTEEDLVNVTTDPRDGVSDNRIETGNKTYNYYYAADQLSYKICTLLEDQGAKDILNFPNDGTELIDRSGGGSASPGELYCLTFEAPGGDLTKDPVALVDPYVPPTS